MKNLRRITASVIAASVVFGMTACTVPGIGNAEADVEEVVESYMENVISGKYSKAAKYVVDGVDDFAEAELDDDYMVVIDAMCAASEYEIVETDVTKDSAKVTIEVVTPRLGSAEDNAAGHQAEDIADAMDDAETLEAEVTLKLTNDDGDWLIKNSGEVTSLYLDTVGSMTFCAISEEEAVEYVDSMYCALEDGDLEAIYILMSSDEIATYEEFVADLDPDSANYIISMAFTTSITHTCTVEEVGEDYVTISVDGAMADPDVILNSAIDLETFSIIVAYQMFAPDRMDEAFLNVCDRIEEELDNHTETIDMHWVQQVRLDENGELTMDTIEYCDSPLVDLNFDDSAFEGQETQIMAIAVTYGLEHGLVTEAELAAYAGATTSGSGSIDVERGSDFFGIWFYTDETFTTTVDYYTTDMTGFFVVFQTTNFYDAGATFTVTLQMVGSDYVYEDVSTSTVDNQDVGHIGIFVDNGVTPGTYIMTITGYDGETFATITFEIAE